MTPWGGVIAPTRGLLRDPHRPRGRTQPAPCGRTPTPSAPQRPSPAPARPLRPRAARRRPSPLNSGPGAEQLAVLPCLLPSSPFPSPPLPGPALAAMGWDGGAALLLLPLALQLCPGRAAPPAPRGKPPCLYIHASRAPFFIHLASPRSQEALGLSLPAAGSGRGARKVPAELPSLCPSAPPGFRCPSLFHQPASAPSKIGRNGGSGGAGVRGSRLEHPKCAPQLRGAGF